MPLSMVAYALLRAQARDYGGSNLLKKPSFPLLNIYIYWGFLRFDKVMDISSIAYLENN